MDGSSTVARSPEGDPPFGQLQSNLATVLAIFALGVAILTCITTGIVLWIAYSPVPWGDMWDYWTWYRKWGHDFLWHLAEQHNEHRIVIARLFFMFDQFCCGGTAKSLAIFIPAIQVAHAITLWRLSLRVPGLRRSGTWFLAAVSFAAMFSSQQFANFTWYFQIQFVAVYFGATVCSIALINLTGQNRPKGPVVTSQHQLRWLVAVLVLATGTTYCMANGLLIWPLLLSLAYCLSLSRRIRLTLLLFGIGNWVTYFWQYVRPPDHPPPFAALKDFPEFLRFLLTVIGSPFGDSIAFFSGGTAGRVERIAALVGGAGLLVAAVVIFSTFRNLSASRHGTTLPVGLVYIHLLLFTLGSMALIASGRFTYASEALTSRYTTPALLFWLFLVSLAVISLARGGIKRALHARSLECFVLAVLLLFVAVDKPGKTSYARGYQQYLSEAQISMSNRVYDKPIWMRVKYDLPELLTLTNFLRAKQLSIYHERWIDWLGDDITRHYREGGQCQGFIDGLQQISSELPGYRLQGWAWDNQSRSSSRNLILTDEVGHIIGAALGHFPRPDVPAALANVSTPFVGWTGYATGLIHSRIVVRMILGHSQTACTIGASDIRR